MTKSIITNHLNKFDYKYTEQGEKVIVELDFSLQMIIDLSENDKIKISDRIKKPNILLCPFKMSIKGVILYTHLGFIAFLILILAILRINDPTNHIVFPIFFIWNSFWMIHYLIRAESFKKEIINLTK